VNPKQWVARHGHRQKAHCGRAKPEALGHEYLGGEWHPPAAPPLPLAAEADAMHGALMRRADDLAGCQEASGEKAELKGMVDLLEAYEAKRWPLGKNECRAGRAEQTDSRGLIRIGICRDRSKGCGLSR
jgi:hypothetical protein